MDCDGLRWQRDLCAVCRSTLMVMGNSLRYWLMQCCPSDISAKNNADIVTHNSRAEHIIQDQTVFFRLYFIVFTWNGLGWFACQMHLFLHSHHIVCNGKQPPVLIGGVVVRIFLQVMLTESHKTQGQSTARRFEIGVRAHYPLKIHLKWVVLIFWPRFAVESHRWRWFGWLCIESKKYSRVMHDRDDWVKHESGRQRSPFKWLGLGSSLQHWLMHRILQTFVGTLKYDTQNQSQSTVAWVMPESVFCKVAPGSSILWFGSCGICCGKWAALKMNVTCDDAVLFFEKQKGDIGNILSTASQNLRWSRWAPL